MTRPNLFIVGAQKAGSTSLYEGLKSHPEIFMSPAKEPALFIPRELRPPSIFGKGRGDADHWRSYLDLFSAASGFRYVGEASPYYSMQPRYGVSAEWIHAFAPDARILYIIRDPVERTISHYWSNVQHLSERRPPMEAIAAEVQYRSVSHYAMQIRPYLALFPRGQVRVLTLEEFSADPAAELRRIFLWLGLDPSLAPLPSDVRENGTPQTIIRSRSRLLERVRSSHPYAVLRGLVPKPLRNLALGLAVRRIDRAHFDLSPVKEFLRPAQLRETEELSALLGREFRQWKTLYSKMTNDEFVSGQLTVVTRPAA